MKVLNQSLFVKRTGSIYQSQVKRFAEKRDKAGRVKRVGRDLPYTIDLFREWVSGHFKESGPQWVTECAYCKGNVSLATFCIDHAVPISRDGGLELSNLALCCSTCNRTKGGLTGSEFRSLMAGLATFPEAARVDILKRLKQGGAYHRVMFSKKAESTADRTIADSGRP